MSELPYTQSIVEKVEQMIKNKLELSLPPPSSPDFQAGFNFSKEIMLKTISEFKTDLLK